MPPRPTRPETDCPECPEKTEPKKENIPTSRFLAITTDNEADILWKHVLTGTETCIRMCEVYQENQMSNMPVKRVKLLAERLARMVENHEKEQIQDENIEADSPGMRSTDSRSSDRDGNWPD